MTARTVPTLVLLLIAATFGTAAGPASAACRVTLKDKPQRVYVGSPVTLTAGATGCDRLKEIVADKAVSGARTFPCTGTSTCAIRVTSTRAMLVRFTARATSRGKVFESKAVAVRWAKAQTPDAPRKFTMVLKSSGRVVWKAVQDLASYKTTYTGGNSGMPSQVSMPGGSKITLSANYDIPIPHDGNVTISESVFNSGGADTIVPLCKATAGRTGCSATFTLRRPEPFRQATTFNAHGWAPAATGPQAWISINVTLLQPS